MGTEDKDKQNKNTTQYALDHHKQTITNNVNKTWALLQTTGDKDKSYIIFMSG